jgi:transposase-like protein
VVIQEAWVHGVSTRKVDDLVAAMGGCHVSKSEVSRICSELDLELALFRERPLDDAAYPYVWFDATYEKVRQGGRSVSQAVVVAMAIRESGEKCILGVAGGGQRDRGLLAGVLPLPGGQGTLRGAAGDLGRP